MNKYQLNPNYSVLMAILSGITLVWVITLFLLGMWYEKRPVIIAGQEYVKEVTRWPGHKNIVNVPVEYE